MRISKIGLLPTFIITSGAIFLLLTLVIIQIVDPLLRANFLTEIEQNTVVFVNRLVSTVFVKENFDDYQSAESQENFLKFRRSLAIPNMARLKIWSPEGVIIFSDDLRFKNKKFEKSFALQALDLSPKTKLINTAELAAESNEYAFDKGLGEVFDVAVPVTLGISRTPVGVVEIFVRTGPLDERIADFRYQLAIRIVISTAVFFIILTGIIIKASKTIRDQQRKLSEHSAQLEEKVLERTKSLEDAHRKENMLKDQFIFIVSHELSTPATAISWNISAFKKSGLFESLNKESQEIFNNIEKSSGQLWRIIRNILEIHRGELGKIQIIKEEFDLKSFIEEAIKSNEAFAQLKKVKIYYSVEDKTATIKSDRERIREVLNNLISNAIQFNHEDGKVTVELNIKENEAVVSIIDTGIGIKEEDKPKVFEKFWRSEDVSKSEGSGLGLFITKFLVEALGGKIWFESKKDQGSTFSFSLPKK